jgi:hypothetical protein
MAAVLTLGSSVAQATSPTWIRQFGTPQDDGGMSLAAGPNGSVYIVSWWSTTNFDANGKTVVRKYGSSGRLSWSRSIREDGYMARSALATDATGVYLAAEHRATTSDPHRYILLRKWDHSGTPQFTRRIGQLDGDALPMLASDGTHVTIAWHRGDLTPGRLHSILIGRLQPDGSVAGETPHDTDSYFSALAADGTSAYLQTLVYGQTITPGHPRVGSTDVLLRRYDLAGHILWTDRFGTTGDNEPLNVAVNSGGVYTLMATDAGHDLKFQRRTQRHSKSGSRGWIANITTNTDYSGTGGIAADATGVYIATVTSRSLSGPVRGQADPFVRKYSNAGAAIWTAQFGTAADYEFPTAAIVSSGAVYVTGSTNGRFSNPGAHPTYWFDAYLAKLRT